MNDSEHRDARAEDGAVSDTTNKRSNDLSPAWAIAGAGLFAIAIAAPVFVVDLSDALKRGAAPQAPAKAQITERTEIESRKSPPTMRHRLAGSLIAAGSGIGPVTLGQSMDQVAENMPRHSWQAFRVDDDVLVRQMGFAVGPADVLIEGKSATGRVGSISIEIASCENVERLDQPQSDLPVTRDGLSLGSHRSRVIARLGTPLRGAPIAPIPGPMHQVREQAHDGIAFSFCPGSELARMVRIERSDGLNHGADTMVSIAPAVSVPIPSPSEASATADGLAVTYTPHGHVNDGKPLTDAPSATDFVAGLPDAAGAVSHPKNNGPAAQPQEIAPIAPVGIGTIGQVRLSDATILRIPPGAQADIQPSKRQPDLARPASPAPFGTIASLSPSPRPPLAMQPRDMGPPATSVADRGLVAGAPETAAPVMAQAPEKPETRAPVDEPSRLAGFGISADSSHPLGMIAPGAALPRAGMPTLNALAAAPSRASSPSIDHRPGDAVFPKAPSLARIIPGKAPTAVDAPALIAALDPALAEAQLGLSRATRRGLQRRLALIGFDSGGVDGIFGPKTRNAIADFQLAENLQPTGFIDPELKRKIERRSQTRYQKWKAIQRQRARQSREAAPRPIVATVRVPRVRKVPECRRDSQGRIALNQGFNCDLTYLKEDLRALFGGDS